MPSALLDADLLTTAPLETAPLGAAALGTAPPRGGRGPVRPPAVAARIAAPMAAEVVRGRPASPTAAVVAAPTAAEVVAAARPGATGR